MEEWVAKNWWWVFPIIVAPAYFAYLLHRRGGNEPLPTRMLYAVVPVLDRNSDERKQLPRIIMLWLIGGVVIAIALLIEQIAFH